MGDKSDNNANDEGSGDRIRDSIEFGAFCGLISGCCLHSYYLLVGQGVCAGSMH